MSRQEETWGSGIVKVLVGRGALNSKGTVCRRTKSVGHYSRGLLIILRPGNNSLRPFLFRNSITRRVGVTDWEPECIGLATQQRSLIRWPAGAFRKVTLIYVLLYAVV
jgi:hypothetical protein